MISKTKITLNLGGLVLFDPQVLNQFVTDNGITAQDLLQHFNEYPETGSKAISEGIIIPVYTITPWDYTIILNTDETGSIPKKQQLFTTDMPFPLHITGGKLIVSDIYAIMDWKADDYLNFPPKEERIGVDDDFTTAPGLYAVTITGFRDKENPDIEHRDCGYEFLLQKVTILPQVPAIDIDSFNFKVDGFVEDSL